MPADAPNPLGHDAELFPELLAEIRRMATSQMARQRRDHTLQPTALVNEVFLRLAGREAKCKDPQHFLRLASRAMRQILTDHAMRKRAAKRPQADHRVPLDDVLDAYESRSLDIVALNHAIDALQASQPELAVIVDLHFFAGRSFAEIAALEDVSTKTIQRRWQAARALLRRELT